MLAKEEEKMTHVHTLALKFSTRAKNWAYTFQQSLAKTRYAASHALTGRA